MIYGFRGRQPAGDVCHKTSSRLLLLSASTYVSSFRASTLLAGTSLCWLVINVGCGLGNPIRQVAPMCPFMRAHWRHMANTTEMSTCGSDAVLCQITLTTCYYHGEDGGGGRWLVRLEWCQAGWSVCLPLLIFSCTIKSRSSHLAPGHRVVPEKGP